jgi:hypothetical protein
MSVLAYVHQLFNADQCHAYIHTSLHFSLRHEVARLIVWHAFVTRPVVPLAVSYADVREGNAPYRACGHGTHSHRLAPEP